MTLGPNINPTPGPILLLFPCVLDPVQLTIRPLEPTSRQPSSTRICTLFYYFPLINTRAHRLASHHPHCRLSRFAVSRVLISGTNTAVRTIACPASLCPCVLISGTWLPAPSPAPLRCIHAFSFQEHGRPHHRLPRFALSTRSHFGNAAWIPSLSLTDILGLTDRATLYLSV